MTAQERAAEVIEAELPEWCYHPRLWAKAIAAALAAAGLLVDDDTARPVKLGKAVETIAARNDSMKYVLLDAIYREAERQS